MPNRNIRTNDKGICIMRHMEDAVVLDVGPLPDPNVMNVSTNYRVEPHTAVPADLNVTNNLGPLSDEHRRVDSWLDSPVWDYHLPDASTYFGGRHPGLFHF